MRVICVAGKIPHQAGLQKYWDTLQTFAIFMMNFAELKSTPFAK